MVTPGMKIVILGENGSTHVQKWIRAISSIQEMNLSVISFDRGAKFENVKYFPLSKFTGTKLDYLLNAGKVRTYLREIKPDLIHAHYATSYGYLASVSGFHPMIITGWGADIFDSPQNPLLKALLKRSFRNAEEITVLSEITRTEIKKLTDKQVRLIPFGVDTEKFKPQKKQNDKLVRIGTIRTLSEKYGVEYLIRAFAIVSEKHASARLEIVGDGPLRSFLEGLARDLGIADKVTFHGYINQNTSFDKYISILGSFDIFAILSILDSETFGVACVEASACGIPVVATSVGGLPEVITDKETGIIVAPKNVEQTADALQKLVSDEKLRKQMGAKGIQKVAEKYNWEANIQQMIALYKHTVENFGKNG